MCKNITLVFYLWVSLNDGVSWFGNKTGFSNFHHLTTGQLVLLHVKMLLILKLNSGPEV